MHHTCGDLGLIGAKLFEILEKAIGGPFTVTLVSHSL
jgi:hypothetical protein